MYMRDYVKCHLNDGSEKIMLRCDVCEGLVDLDDTICKKCGFDNHIIPDDASPEIQEIERKRIEAARKVAEAIKKLEDLETTLKKEQTAHEETKSDLENEKTAHERTKSNLAKEQTAHNKTKAALKKEKTDHEETKSDLATEQTAHNKTKAALKKEQTAHEETEYALVTEQTAHNRTKDALKDEEEAHKRTKAKLVIEKVAHAETKSNLDKEQTAHNRTQDALKKEQDAHMQTKKKLDDAIKNPPTSPDPVSPPIPTRPNKKVIGMALFTQGGRSETVALYEGVCRVTAPAWTNVKGELFEIKPINDIYILRDLIGNMCDRNNRRVSSKGVPASHGDCFTIGELVIRLTLPEFL